MTDTPGRQKQRPFDVPRDVVDGLVDAFIASNKGHCTSFRPAEMRAAFRALPGAESVSMHHINAVLEAFVCYKMTGWCNSWTSWMRHRLNATKARRP